MGKASNFNIGRIKIVWFFFWCGNEKMLKINFFQKCSFLEICSKKKISGLGPCETPRPDVSENVELIGRVRFWTGVIGRQRWTSPKQLVRHRKYEASKKIDTATILSFELCHGISVEPTILGPRWFRIRAQNWILWPCLFFLRLLSLEFFLKFSPDFDSQ